MILQIARISAVVALLGAAAALASPKGRLPIALRGIRRALGRADAAAHDAPVPAWRRAAAFALALAAVVLALA
ncbi:MAG: hypothetical protein IJS36_05755 [Kiritimatiellae bacterium]|nr:hypothetical protein [Kiritimatiellia bacterium]